MPPHLPNFFAQSTAGATVVVDVMTFGEDVATVALGQEVADAVVVMSG